MVRTLVHVTQQNRNKFTFEALGNAETGLRWTRRAYCACYHVGAWPLEVPKRQVIDERVS